MSATGVYIGRRTGCNIKAGKVIRKVDNVFDDFSDYWTESENEPSLQNLPEPVKRSTHIGDATSCLKNDRMLRSMSPFPSSDHSNTLAILKKNTNTASRTQDEQLLSQEQKTGSALTDEGDPEENLNICHNKQNVEINRKDITSAKVSPSKQSTALDLSSSVEHAKPTDLLKLLPQGNDLGSISRIEVAAVFPQIVTNSAVEIFNTKKRLTYSDGGQETTQQSLPSNETSEVPTLSQRKNQVADTFHHVADKHQLLDGATEQSSIHQSKSANCIVNQSQKKTQQPEQLTSQDTQRPETEQDEGNFIMLRQRSSKQYSEVTTKEICTNHLTENGQNKKDNQNSTKRDADDLGFKKRSSNRKKECSNSEQKNVQCGKESGRSKMCTKLKGALDSTDVKEKQQDQRQDASSKCLTADKSRNQKNHLNQSQQPAAQVGEDSSGEEQIVEDPCLSKGNETNSVKRETECITKADDKDGDDSEDFFVVLDDISVVYDTNAFNKGGTPKTGTQRGQPKLNPRSAATRTQGKRRMSTKPSTVIEKDPPIYYDFNELEDESLTEYMHPELNTVPSLSTGKHAKNKVSNRYKAHTSKQRQPRMKLTKGTNKRNSKLRDRSVLTEEENVTEDTSSSEGKLESGMNRLPRKSHKGQTCVEELDCNNDNQKETQVVSEKLSKLSKLCGRRSKKCRGGQAPMKVQETSSNKSEQDKFSNNNNDVDLTESDDGVRSQAVVPAEDPVEQPELNVDVEACYKKGKRSISEALASDKPEVPPAKKSKHRARHSTKENNATSRTKGIKSGMYSLRKQKGDKQHLLQSETNVNDETPAEDTRGISQTKNKGRKRKGKSQRSEESEEAVKSPATVPTNNSDLFSLDLSPIRGPAGQNYIDDSDINPYSSPHKCYKEGTRLENHLVAALKHRSRCESVQNHDTTDQCSSSPVLHGAEKSSLRDNQSSLQSSPSLVHYQEVVISRTKAPIQQTEEKPAKIIVPEPSTNGLRRSHRTRVMPLEWYRNERIKYERRESGLVVAGIESPLFNHDGKPINRTEKLRQLVKKRKQKKTRLPKTPRNLSVHEPNFMNHTARSTSEIPVIDPTTQKEVSLECVVTKDQHSYYNMLGEPAGPDDGLLICKTIIQPTFSLGLLILRPLEEKKMQRVRKDSMAFIIKQGKVAVTIYRSTSVLETDDCFLVPSGNTYCIKNLRRDEAKLWFYQHKG